MEDWKKKYEETLRKAKEYYAGVPGSREFLDNIFPELAESEDERIRNDIRTVVREWWYKIGDCTPKFSTEDEMLAWLEKQKPGNKVESFADAFDTEFQKQVANIIASVLNKEHEYSKGYIEWIAQSLLGYAKNEIKPAEWSDGDRQMFRNCEDAIRLAKDGRKISADYDEMCSWLKSLRPQPKQEWSEEDEKCFDAILCDIVTADKYFGGRSTYIEKRRWLESLRPQKQWKPSEEQMRELKNVISGCSHETSVLVSLENDLKKLIEL